MRPSIETQWPDVRIFAHLDHRPAARSTSTPRASRCSSAAGAQDKGDAPLKETLAAAMLAASGWWNPETGEVPERRCTTPAAAAAPSRSRRRRSRCGIAAGPAAALRLREAAALPGPCVVGAEGRGAGRSAAARSAPIFGSRRVAPHGRLRRSATPSAPAWPSAVQLRGGDALQRMPPAERGVILLNPPYGERIEVGGVAGARPAAAASRRKPRTAATSSRSWPATGRRTTPAGPPGC